MVHGLLVAAAAERPEGQVASRHVVESHADGPQVHSSTEGLADRLAQHGTFVHIRVKVFFSAVKGYELLVILQFPGRSEVCQLVHYGAVVLDELHDVARLEISVDEVVVPQVVHSGAQVTQDQQPLILVQPKVVFRIV